MYADAILARDRDVSVGAGDTPNGAPNGARNGHPARVRSGVAALDAMLGGQGFIAGSVVLVSGPPGAGKSTLAAHFADTVCRRGERCLYAVFEEAARQLVRNMQSVSIDLAAHQRASLLQVLPVRAALPDWGAVHSTLERAVAQYQPTAVILDPISGALTAAANGPERSAAIHLLDWLRDTGVTTLLTTPTSTEAKDCVDPSLSSLVDSWVRLQDSVVHGERRQELAVVKARGMEHSNRSKAFMINARGIELDRRKSPRIERYDAEFTDSPFGAELA